MNIDKDKIIDALREELTTLKTIISKMPGHVYWKSVEGYYLGCNEAMAKIANLSSPDEIIGTTDRNYIQDPKILETIHTTDREVLKNNKVEVEELGFDSEGEPAYYITQKSPLHDNSGKIIGILGVSMNITERKQMENKLKIAKQKAEAANHSKSQFLAMISHELRTPLTGLLGMVNFLNQENISEKEKKEYIEHIIQSGAYLKSLINNLLDYNKLENNKYELILETLNLKKLFNNALSMLENTAREKGLKLVSNFDEAIPNYIESDNQVLMQIIINLLNNAIKFTECGKILLKAKLIKLEEKNCDIKISVKDTGVGISSENLKAIFKRFHQLNDVYTKKASRSGVGLGLSIVKKLVKLLGGKIRVKSSIGVGSTFYFTITVPYVNQTVKIKEPQAIYQLTSANILLIEDDLLIQIIHTQMLKDLNCNVDIAENAQIALKKLEKKYDMVFVDIGLPDINGFELIKRIKNTYPTLPVIALTGYSEPEETQRCLAVGANEVIIKPISAQKLGTALATHLATD